MFTSPLYFNQIRLNSQFGRLQSESQEWSGSWRLYSSFSTLCYHPPNICIIKPRHMIKGYIAVNYHRDSGQKNPTGWNSEFNGASTYCFIHTSTTFPSQSWIVINNFQDHHTATGVYTTNLQFVTLQHCRLHYDIMVSSNHSTLGCPKYFQIIL